jgi:hypothetical protein
MIRGYEVTSDQYDVYTHLHHWSCESARSHESDLSHAIYQVHCDMISCIRVIVPVCINSI